MASDFNHIPDVIAKLQQVAPQIVKKGAFDVEAAMKRRAAVESGFMRSAIYTETVDGSTYGQGLEGDASHLEPALNGNTNGGMTAWAVAGADYSIYVNNGTAHQPSQPFAEPAADEVRPSYEAAWQKLQEALDV